MTNRITQTSINSSRIYKLNFSSYTFVFQFSPNSICTMYMYILSIVMENNLDSQKYDKQCHTKKFKQIFTNKDKGK